MSLVSDGYDQIATTYLQQREHLGSGKYVQQVLKLVPKKSTILDLGCGAGVPVDDIFIKAGHSVIGIDISPEQIKLARKKCKGGDFLVGDISQLKPGEYSVEAVVSFYTLFHAPRGEHLKILKVMGSFLKKDGVLLVTMGDREFEGEHLLHGAKMWSSQYGTAKNRGLIESAGFKILNAVIDVSGGERHLVILAQKG